MNRERLVDATVAVLTAVAVWVGPSAVNAPVTYEGAGALGVTLGGLLLLRRRWPMGVLLASAAVLIGWQSADLFEGGWVWPLTAALFTAAAFGSLRWSGVVGGLLIVYAIGWDLSFDSSHALASAGAESLWLALVLAVANAYRQQQRWRAEHAARLVQLEETRLAEQRLQISREVHDVVAHTLAVVGVHLNVAADALSLEEARASLRTAMEVRARAMNDLKAFIGDLRSEPPPSLSGVEDLLRATGLEVSFVSEGDLDGVPAAQSVAAYRVLQEAVTNTLKHSGARNLTVRLTASPTLVAVSVTDDGSGPASFTEGHGLTGMRERVAALGGTLEVASGDGFSVQARLPVSGSAP